MSISDLSFEEFTKKLADKVPTPGGGGASAAVASMASALCSMVGNYSLGKEKCSNEEMKALLDEAEMLRVKLNAYIDKDADAFKPLSEAYKIPDSDPCKETVMETCLRNAALVPFEVLKLSCQVIDLSDKFSKYGSDIMLSDAACAAVFAWSAMYAAAVNIRINTKMMSDRSYAESLNKETDDLMGKYWKIADRVYEDIYSKLA